MKEVDITNDWQARELDDSLHSKTMILNMGPAHPATHGTIRLILEIDGERVERCDVDLGYLHRGFEKQCENVNYNQVIPYTDRLNYVSPIINNVGWVIAIENMFGVEVPIRAQYIRVIMSELSRMCDHITCVGAAAMELGAFTVMLYLMQAREELYDLIEKVTGARLTISYTRVGGLRDDLPANFKEEVFVAFEKISKHLTDADRLVSRNRIFQDRMAGVGIISKEEAISYGLTGPIGRASGVNYDVRKAFPYSSYDHFDFEVPTGTKGDNLDRFLVRFNEIYESMKIVEQALRKLPDGPINIDDPHIILPPKDEVYNSIEGMINQFEVVFGGIKPPAGDIYFPVEGGNGELGFYVVSDGSGTPYRVRVRPPCFVAMGIFGPLVEGHTIADIVPLFGMINMIGGECDR
jgi:NADH-quinone oxidoreductase subunit D